MPGQQLQGSVDFEGEQRGGLFLCFISCVSLDKSLNPSESLFLHLEDEHVNSVSRGHCQD